MSAFDIPPHSRRTTHLAMGLLALVAMAAFTQGFLRQLSSETPAPPPRAMPGDTAIAEATPAPVPALQVPTASPKPRKALAEADAGPPALLDVPPAPGSPAAGVTAPTAADASATAPATPAPSPTTAAAPEPEAAPT